MFNLISLETFFDIPFMVPTPKSKRLTENLDEKDVPSNEKGMVISLATPRMVIVPVTE